MVPALFKEKQLSYDELIIYATPRRIALMIKVIPVDIPDVTNEYKGPAVKVAYIDGDPTGEPSKALLGFMRSKGLDPADIEVRPVDGVDYVFAQATTCGGKTIEVLPKILAAILNDIEWKKTQRWGSGELRFVRPVRWLVALFGNEVISLSIEDLVAGRYTRGHRFLSRQKIELAGPHEYARVLKRNNVSIDQAKRRKLIEEQSQEISAPYGTVLLDKDVLAEVINLTEHPNAILGVFDEEFLRAPREILEYAMAKHQRYFAIQREDGSLDYRFVVISNGDPAYTMQIGEGHERVVRARLADAVFFYDEDLKKPLSEWREKLQTVVFQEKLGTVLDKAKRVEDMVFVLAVQTNTSADESEIARRAAHLAKADLVTNAVIEFPNLQGVMGRYYALAQNEDEQVANAIEEHYRPRFSGDTPPTSHAGQLVSIADKMDTIAGIFAIGKAPKGTSDPFALRRNAIGILQIALQSPRLNLDAVMGAALDQIVDVVDFDYDAVLAEIKAFFVSRLETILKESGFSTEVVKAVLARSATHPADIYLRCKALDVFKEHKDMLDLSTAFTRAKNLARPDVGLDIDSDLLTVPERTLHDALEALEDVEPDLVANQSYPELLTRFAQLREPVDVFFDAVMIMDEDEAIRANRLALLNRLVALIEGFADLRQMALKK
jgi:glycyl-tRNA synthetase beta chain